MHSFTQLIILITMRRLYALIPHREILTNLVLRNLRVRYKGSVLGFFWAFLNPLLTMLVFYIVFSRVIKIQIKQYPLFLLSALLPWTCFAASLTDAAGCIIDNANLVKKVYFPREILPISYVLSNFINFLFSLAILLPILVICRLPHPGFIYFLPMILAIHVLFTAGLALFFSCANVYFRDVGQMLNVLLMFWFYLTPVVYPLEMVPQKFYHLYQLNPMTLVVGMYRRVLFSGEAPGAISLAGALLAAGAALLIGHFIFTRCKSGLSKEL